MKMVNVVVIGDIMLDVYTELEDIRLSPEAPVFAGRCGTSRHYLGGAANVAANCKALGSHTKLVGVIGLDEPGRILRELCHEINVPAQWGLSKAATIVKTRLVDVHGNHVVRFDVEDRLLRDEWMRCVYQSMNTWSNFIKDVHSVVISDYAKGVGVNGLSEALRLCRTEGKFIVVNTKPINWRLCSVADVVVFNKDEAQSIMTELGVLWDFSDMKAVCTSVQNFAEAVQKRGEVEWKNLVVTLGSRGLVCAVIRDISITVQYYPTAPVTVADVAGAGDTIVATIASAGACTPAVLKFAQANAAKVVSKRGTQTP